MTARARRRLGIVAAAILVGITCTWLWLTPPSSPDEILFHGGSIVTMDDAHPQAEALLVRDGRIVAVGDLADVRAQASGAAADHNLKGATLIPGLIEPHTHPLATALFGATVDVSGFNRSSRADVMAALKEAAGAWHMGDRWIMAFGWDPVMVDDLEPPTLAELDAISPDRPLVILTQMMHDAYANSAALKAAGITRDTPDPEGGSFGRDADGNLTGVVREVRAIGALFTKAPPPPKGSAELLLNMTYGDYARAGYTTIGIAAAVGPTADAFGLVRRRASAGDAPVQSVVYALPTQLTADSKPEDHTKPGALIGVKFWMDGSPYAGGAALEEPYADTPLVHQRLHLPIGHRGDLNFGIEAFEEEFEAYHKRGFQIEVHVQGERAVERVLGVAERVLAKYPRTDHRYRLEHNALITAGQLKRAQALGFTTSFFVDHLYYYGHRLPDLVGSERTARYMPLRSALDAGLKISLHGDHPATPIRTLRPFATAISRTPRRGGPALGPDQLITRTEALRAMTLDAAWQLGLEGERGSLEVGKAADLAVLSANPLTEGVAPDEITVQSTWIAGKRVDTRKATAANAGLMWQMVKGFF